MSSSLEQLPAIPGGWTEKVFSFGSREFTVALPANPDAFLDDPAVHAAHARDEYMPYWPYLWPAAHGMAEAIMRAEWEPGTRALEIGAGIGLAGLAALARGLCVTFSDYAADSIQLALYNARQNGFDADGTILDWRAPASTRYPVILGSDVVYDLANHRPILDLLDKMLADGGVCWMGDAGRQNGGAFFHLARQEGWRVDLRDADDNPLPQPVVGRFQLMRLTRTEGERAC
jgi:predicted nicotinamide N-methyase